MNPALFPSQLPAAVWSWASVLVDLIAFRQSTGLLNHVPGPAPWLCSCLLPEGLAGALQNMFWSSVERLLFLVPPDLTAEPAEGE